MTPPRCPHCGAVAADPVGEMIAAMKAGKVAELSPSTKPADILHARCVFLRNGVAVCAPLD